MRHRQRRIGQHAVLLRAYIASMRVGGNWNPPGLVQPQGVAQAVYAGRQLAKYAK